jgi:protein-S-isoprenylcysteine O-methyltransferase Ste14
MDPTLKKERVDPGPGVKSWDRVIVPLLRSSILLIIILASLDSGRFRWAPTRSCALGVLGYLGLFLAFVIVHWAITENRFFSSHVRIQSDRGHALVSGGPYAHVRHPGYTGIALMALALPLVLGSWVAMLPAIASVAILLVRTNLEDSTLTEELKGYREYTTRVRYRLIPMVW